MQEYWNTIKNKVRFYVQSNLDSDRLFDKAKIIFIGLVIFLVFFKVIHSIIT